MLEPIARTSIICLANSWKRQQRCIAGILPSTGEWVRPVTDTPDGSVPDFVRKLRKREPALRDVLEIPLATTGPDFGFERENRLIESGRWYTKGRVQVSDLFNYLDDEPTILHNDERWVPLAFMQGLPPERRRTLQLIETTSFQAIPSTRSHSGDRVWVGSFTTRHGAQLRTNITDPAFSARLDNGYRPGDHCLVTMSLSMPWQPADRPDVEARCYKLIAGIIEVDDRYALTPADLADVPF